MYVGQFKRKPGVESTGITAINSLVTRALLNEVRKWQPDCVPRPLIKVIKITMLKTRGSIFGFYSRFKHEFLHSSSEQSAPKIELVPEMLFMRPLFILNKLFGSLKKRRVSKLC